MKEPNQETASDSLQASLISSLLDSIPDLIFYKDLEGVYLGGNPAFIEFVGIPKAEIVGKTDFDLFENEIAVRFRQYDLSVLEAREGRHNEEWVTYPDGRKVLLDTLKTPYWGPDGELIGMLGVSRDITGLKQTEAELRQASERLALATRSGGVGTWDLDVANNRLVWDDQMFRLYGITRETFGGAYEAWQSAVHPDDRQRADERIQMVLRCEVDFDIEFRVRWPDGTIRHIQGLAKAEQDAAGRTVRLIGTNWDITDRKLAQEALCESEANFRTFFETLTDLVLVCSGDGYIQFVNQAADRLLGYPVAELIGKHVLELHPPNKLAEAAKIFAAMMRGERQDCPLPLVRRDGTRIPVETRIWHGKWNGIECMFAICKDLTAEQEAKQRFESLFNSNPCVIALLSLPDGRFVEVNDALLKTLGYSREEVLGRTAGDIDFLGPPEHKRAATERMLRDGCLTDLEIQIRSKDRRLIDGLVSIQVIGSQGQQFAMVVMVDITARKQAEKELETLLKIQRELTRLATEFINIPMDQQDQAINQSLALVGGLVKVDRAYLFAYDFAAGIARNTHEWCAAGIAPRIDAVQAVTISEMPAGVETHRRGELVLIPSVAELPADGGLRQVLEMRGVRSLVTLPLMYGGNCLGFVGFDATREERVWREGEIALLRVLAELFANFEARRNAERENRDLQMSLIESRDAAQAAAHAKSLFLANMSHEIRTPLNAVLGYAQIMQRECRECSNGGRLTAITRGGEHLLELLTDLLELVRTDAHEITLAPCDFDFPQVLEDVRLMFERLPDARGLVLEFSHGPEMPRVIRADSGKVRQILMNLVGNAVKFTDRGGVRVSAAVLPGGHRDGFVVGVEIEDTGGGLGPDEIERIFEIFEQAQPGRKTSKGVGLGLPLSRRYARAMGGEVTVTSQPGVGSRVRFTFQAQAAGSGGSGPEARGEVLRVAPNQPVRHLLVVDDEAENRAMLADLLTAVGFTVETADTAELALARLAEAGGVDLVLMDKWLPGMDGYRAISRLRELPATRELPVVVVTASGAADEPDLAHAAGADGYLAKPVQRDRLLAEIGRLTGVEYVYGEPFAVPNTQPAALESTVLAGVSIEQLRLVAQALKRGDFAAMRGLITELADKHAGLAVRLAALVDDYDYDGLNSLLEAAKGNAL